MRTWRAPAFSLACLLALGTALAGGQIHGTIHTRDGKSLTGPMRWGGSESFWDDFLDAAKPGVIREEGERRQLRVLFWKVADLDGSRSSWVRSFTVPFGHVSRIEPTREDTVDLTLKNGDVVTVRQWSSDLGPSLVVQVVDGERGEVEVAWDRIDAIEFDGGGTGSRDDQRLYGTVETTCGPFTGYILWDRDEAMLEDTLDGEEGHRERDVRFDEIASIERASSRASRVTLRSGEVVELRGTNDVDRDNRGIDVLVDDIGRVRITWDVFVRVDFTTPPSSPPYDTFDGGHALRGRLITHDGRELRGRVVWDEDEEYDWEVLDGVHQGLEYEILFRNIRSIMPGSAETARVRLRNGDLLILDGHKDVNQEIEGIVVIEDDGTETELDWADVRLVTFDRS